MRHLAASKQLPISFVLRAAAGQITHTHHGPNLPILTGTSTSLIWFCGAKKSSIPLRGLFDIQDLLVDLRQLILPKRYWNQNQAQLGKASMSSAPSTATAVHQSLATLQTILN